jgi:hypothetical protein
MSRHASAPKVSVTNASIDWLIHPSMVAAGARAPQESKGSLFGFGLVGGPLLAITLTRRASRGVGGDAARWSAHDALSVDREACARPRALLPPAGAADQAARAPTRWVARAAEGGGRARAPRTGVGVVERGRRGQRTSFALGGKRRRKALSGMQAGLLGYCAEGERGEGRGVGGKGVWMRVCVGGEGGERRRGMRGPPALAGEPTTRHLDRRQTHTHTHAHRDPTISPSLLCTATRDHQAARADVFRSPFLRSPTALADNLRERARTRKPQSTTCAWQRSART